jgi:hypothetical protein
MASEFTSQGDATHGFCVLGHVMPPSPTSLFIASSTYGGDSNAKELSCRQEMHRWL